jgi:hypothetical protein
MTCRRWVILATGNEGDDDSGDGSGSLLSDVGAFLELGALHDAEHRWLHCGVP